VPPWPQPKTATIGAGVVLLRSTLTTNIDYSTTAILENVFVIYDCDTRSAICM